MDKFLLRLRSSSSVVKKKNLLNMPCLFNYWGRIFSLFWLWNIIMLIQISMENYMLYQAPSLRGQIEKICQTVGVKQLVSVYFRSNSVSCRENSYSAFSSRQSWGPWPWSGDAIPKVSGYLAVLIWGNVKISRNYKNTVFDNASENVDGITPNQTSWSMR